MTNKRTEAVLDLHQRVEKITRLADATHSETLSHDETQKLLHELQTHQIELETQNVELRRIQHDLETSHARYFYLYDLAPVGYLTISKEGLILEANLTIATMLDVPRNFLLGKLMSHFIFPEDKALFYEQRKRLDQSGELQNWEMRLKRTDGTFFWAQLQAILTHDGESWITLNDITELKLSLQSRLTAMAELISAIAHQWRQPLATLGMMIQRTHAVGTKQTLTVEYLNELKDNAMRQIRYMSDTIDEFRDFYSPEKQKMIFSPLACICEAVKLLEPQFTVNGIIVDVSCKGSSGELLYSFSNEFKQVILNLLINARDSILERRKTGDGPEDGRITVQITVKDEHSITIDISDNGCGVPVDISPKIFAPYFTTKEEAGGTGIGLYMSRMIVEESFGGQINLLQKSGETTFRITLPLERSI